jgi:hypothetical protein
MTNLASFAHSDAPLFVFHLLEWMRVNHNYDIDELNARWADRRNIDTWSQLVVKHTKDSVDRITKAPKSGIWELDDAGGMRFLRAQMHRRTVHHENRAFWLRIASVGDYRYEGADLGILVSPGRFMDENFELTPRAKAWIEAIRSEYGGEVVASAPIPANDPDFGGFKLL